MIKRTPEQRIGYFTILCEVCEKCKPHPKQHALPAVCDDCFKSQRLKHKNHAFYQDSIPQRLGYCDYTYPNGDRCGVIKADHA